MLNCINKGIVTCVILMIISIGFSGLFTDNTEGAGVSKEEILKSIEKGISWLVKQQRSDGSWGIDSYKIPFTGFVLIKLQEYAYENGKSPFDTNYTYRNEVIKGWEFIFKNISNNQTVYGNIHKMLISNQTHGETVDNPDTRKNGFGLYFGDGSYMAYNTGICLMALSASGTPDRINDGGLDFDGDNVTDTFFEIAQDTVDWIAFAQGDSSLSEGGWGYSYLDNTSGRTDNSVGGYVVLGLAAAEQFGCVIPQWVKEKLSIWIDNLQDPIDNDSGGWDGGSWYTPGSTSHSPNLLRTGNLIFEMTFCGDIKNKQRFKAALDFIERHWHVQNTDPGWGYNHGVSEYQAMFCIMKGFEYSYIDYIDLDGFGEPEHNWYQEFAEVLITQQEKEGYWPKCAHGDNTYILSTVWALLTLEKIAPAEYISKPPKANAGEFYLGFEGSPIIFNGSLSNDPDGDNLEFHWDFDYDGIWDTNWSDDPLISYTFGDDWVGMIVLEVREKDTPEGYTAKDTAIVFVKNISPTLNVSSNMTINKGEILRLYAEATDPGSDDLHFEWIWGYAIPNSNYSRYFNNQYSPDPYPSVEINPRLINTSASSTFIEDGYFIVTLIVKDDDGGSCIRYISVRVFETEFENKTNITPTNPPKEPPPIEPPKLPSPNIPPIALIKANPVTGVAPLKVYFTGSGSDEDGTIVRFSWTFGDGLNVKHNVQFPRNNSYNNPVHTFDKPGVYFVNLVVTDDDGANGSDMLTIIVNEKQEKVEEFCHITGYVYEAKTSNGISGSNVSIGPIWVKTSSSGFYYIDIPKGEHKIEVDKGGYESTSAIVLATHNVTKDFYLKPITTPIKEIEYTRDYSILWVIVLIIILTSIIISSLIARKKRLPRYDYYDESIKNRPKPKPRLANASTKPMASKPTLVKQQLPTPKPAIIIGTPEKQSKELKKSETPQLTQVKPKIPKPTLAKLDTPQPTLSKPVTPQPTLAKPETRQPTLAIPQPTLTTPQPTLAKDTPTISNKD